MAAISKARLALEGAYEAAAAEVWRQVEAGEAPYLSPKDIVTLLSHMAALKQERQGRIHLTHRQYAHNSLSGMQKDVPKFLEEVVEWRLGEAPAADILGRRLGRPPTPKELSTYSQALARARARHEARFAGLGYSGLKAVQLWPDLASVIRQQDWEEQED